jgi:hypothetical protein
MRGFYVRYVFIFIERGGGFGCARAFGVPTACATAGSMLDVPLIFIDPCAGRHSLFCCAKKSKQKKALYTANPKCPSTAL